MKVLMVTPTYYPIIGGSEVVVKKLLTKLNEMGIHTDVMTFNMDKVWKPKWNGRIEINDGFSVFKIPALNWYPMQHSDRITAGLNLIPGRFTNLLREYDILHFHGGDLSFPIFSHFSKKPKIFHLHALRIDVYKRHFLNRLLLKNAADLHISLTKHMEQELVELGIPQDKIKRLPVGVDVKIFRPSLEKEDNLVLFVGRICFDKGLHILLKSLAFLENPIQLVIVGPPGWDPGYFSNILDLVEKVNRMGNHRIVYLGGLDHKDTINQYQRASMLVLPSVGPEALGIVNLEALACETPVVATNVGGIPEAVCNGENGMLVPPNDPIELARAMQYMLDNKSVRRKFGEHGRTWVTNNFSDEVIMEKLLQIYNELT